MAALIRRFTKSCCSSTSVSSSSINNKTLIPNLILPSSLIYHRGIASKLFVGGLSFYTTEKTLAEAFSQYGQVVEAKIIHDRLSDRSKGFGFVTFASEDEADKALAELNGKSLHGRVIYVDHAKPKIDWGSGMPIARGPPDDKSCRTLLFM